MPKQRIGGKVTYVSRGAAAPQAAPTQTTAQATVTTNAARAIGVTNGWGIRNGVPIQMPTAPASSANADGWTDMTDTAATLLRRQMGQTGDEAGPNKRFTGDPNTIYVQVSKSYMINQALRTDMQSTFNHGWDQKIKNSTGYWVRNGFDMNEIKKAIRKIDAGMKPLTHDTKLVRYDGDSGAMLEQITGVKGLSVKQLSGMSASQVNKLFTGKTITDKAYSSASWRMTNSSRDQQYTSLPVKWELTVQTGVHAVVTNNTTEHEVLLGRGYSKAITGAKIKNGQLVISANVYKDGRSGYYKV